MPEMNGFEATEYIRTTMNSKIPINGRCYHRRFS
jgi:CheY-like chemotaxis protein